MVDAVTTDETNALAVLVGDDPSTFLVDPAVAVERGADERGLHRTTQAVSRERQRRPPPSETSCKTA